MQNNIQKQKHSQVVQEYKGEIDEFKLFVY
jgi:hypothetical protein